MTIGEISEYNKDTKPGLLLEYCARAAFVYNLSGVNRLQNQPEFMARNISFASILLDTLKSCGKTCAVILSSSIQATLIGHYDSEYVRSKKTGEALFFAYGEKTGQRAPLRIR